MRRKLTKKPLKNWALAPSTDEPSPASASSGQHLRHGQHCERVVAQYLTKQGWQLIFQNQKICGIEVDLLFYHPHGVYKLVEVKSLKSQNRWAFRLNHKQKQRLLFAYRYLVDRWRCPIEFDLALVSGNDQVSLIPVQSD